MMRRRLMMEEEMTGVASEMAEDTELEMATDGVNMMPAGVVAAGAEKLFDNPEGDMVAETMEEEMAENTELEVDIRVVDRMAAEVDDMEMDGVMLEAEELEDAISVREPTSQTCAVFCKQEALREIWRGFGKETFAVDAWLRREETISVQRANTSMSVQYIMSKEQCVRKKHTLDELMIGKLEIGAGDWGLRGLGLDFLETVIGEQVLDSEGYWGWRTRSSSSGSTA